MDFEAWIRAQLAGERARPVTTPRRLPPAPRRLLPVGAVQMLVLLGSVGAIGVGLGSAGATGPVQLEVVRAAPQALPVTTWAGSPPAPASLPPGAAAPAAASEAPRVAATHRPPRPAAVGTATPAITDEHHGGETPSPVPSAGATPSGDHDGGGEESPTPTAQPTSGS